MATVTKVCFEGISKFGNKLYKFRTLKSKTLYVETFEDGIAVINPTSFDDDTITSVIEMIAGCLAEDSNFVSELFKAFECDANTLFTGIKFEFNGVSLLVTKDNAEPDKIYAEWEAGMQASCFERKKYFRTSEFNKEKIAKILKISEKTVRNHISNAMQKLGVKGRASAVVELLKLGEISL